MRKINQLFGILGIGLMSGSVFLPAIQVGAAESKTNVEANSTDEDSYTKEALAAYDKAEKLVKQAQKTKKVEDIRKAYQAFIQISPELTAKNYDAYSSQDQMDEIFYDVYFLIDKNFKGEEKAEEFLKFAKAWQKVLLEHFTSLYVNHFTYFVTENEIKSIQPDLDKLLEELNRWVKGIPSQDGIIPLGTDEEIQKLVDEYAKKNPDDDEKPKRLTDEDIQKEMEAKYPQDTDDDDLTSDSISYEKIGDDWYEITETITIGGKITKTTKRKMTIEESYFLRVQEDPTYDPYSTEEEVEFVSDEEWEYYTTDQNPESKWTIHYTVNKDAKTPYYYDTGIRVTDDKEATYEQYKDILLILVDKAGGYLVEDKNKILVVLEGKTIVINDTKDHYSKQELESLFEKFDKVDIRIMETSIGQAGSLEEQIVSKKAQTVKVNGKEVDLKITPSVKNDRAMLPVEQIAYALGGNMKQSGNSYKVQKGDTTVIYQPNNKSISVNGKEIELVNAPELNDEDVLMSEANELATAFGYDMTWDTESSTINFDKR